MPLRLLQIAKTALLTHRSALQVVGHNTANVETPGYVRQRPILAAIAGAVTGEAGDGVRMVDIQRLKDEFLSAQLTYERGWLGQDRALAASLDQVEHIFSDVIGGGLATRLEEMFDAWGTLGLDPSGAAAREQVVQTAELAAQTIADRWHRLRDLRVQIDQRLTDMVTQANALAHQIADINAKIGSVAAPGGRNELITQREGLLADLAGLCGAESIQQENDVVDVLIGGRRIVQFSQVTELELVPDPAQPGFHLVSLGGAVSPAGLRGEIAGRLQARDAFIPEYMQRLDTLAQALADELNSLHSAGFDLNGDPAGDFFEYDAGGPAATLAVREEILADPSLIGAAEAAGAPGDGTNAMTIQDLRNSRILSGGTCTFSEFTAELIARIGMDARAAQTRLDGRQMLADDLEAAYLSQSGVALDEEAVELIRYQQAYTAAARLISAAVTMMDSILELR